MKQAKNEKRCAIVKEIDRLGIPNRKAYKKFVKKYKRHKRELETNKNEVKDDR